jgi:hypothetical protein
VKRREWRKAPEIAAPGFTPLGYFLPPRSDRSFRPLTGSGLTEEEGGGKGGSGAQENADREQDGAAAGIEVKQMLRPPESRRAQHDSKVCGRPGPARTAACRESIGDPATLVGDHIGLGPGRGSARRKGPAGRGGYRKPDRE